jgi:hypothetical protein
MDLIAIISRLNPTWYVERMTSLYRCETCFYVQAIEETITP